MKERVITTRKRKIEIFSAGCPICESVVARVRELACPSCDVEVLDMGTAAAQRQAIDLGINSVPAVVIDGQLADCCSSRGVDEKVLHKAGLGQALP